MSFLRRSAEETDLITVNLSNTPFRGTVETAAADWNEIPLGKAEPKAAALPALSLDAFQARIFRRLTPGVPRS